MKRWDLVGMSANGRAMCEVARMRLRPVAGPGDSAVPLVGRESEDRLESGAVPQL